MSYGISSIPGPSGQAEQHDVQRELQRLLQQLSWSYVALWSFNHQSRSLVWTGGHFRGNSIVRTSHGNTEVWNGHLFSSTYKACTFAPGQGPVGMAYAERRNIWMNGAFLHSSAGSEGQAQFLHHSKIETAVYIPYAESVLELGTCESVAEDADLMKNILQALGHAGVSQAPPNVSQLPLVARSPTTTTTRAADVLQTQKAPLPAPNQASLLSARFQYRSQSGTPSSSMSSLEESSTRVSLNSPEQSMSLMRRNSHSHASSSARTRETETPSHSPEIIQLGNTNTNTNTTTGITTAPQHLHDSLLTGGEPLDTQEEWEHMYMLDSSALQNMHLFYAHENQPQLQTTTTTTSSSLQDQRSAFEAWQGLRAPIRERKEGSTNHHLLRRCFEMMRQIPNLQQGTQTHGTRGTRLTSSSSPEKLPEHDSFDEAGPSRVRRQPRGGSRIGTTTGAVHTGHSEAARLHMMSERRRRLKQKENFIALRQLVPIISKNDKASILGDAIIYVKDLQERIQELEASKDQIESQYEKLKASHLELEQRNKQLLELAMAARSSGGPSHPPAVSQ